MQPRTVRTETDQLGFSHQKFAQYYQGVRVEHATYTAHSRGGQPQSLSGDLEQVPALSVVPALNASEALTRALAAEGAQKYMWQDAREEAGLKQQNRRPGRYLPAAVGELVLVRDNRRSTDGTARWRWAWKFNVYAQLPVSRALHLRGCPARGEVVAARCHHQARHRGTATFATAYSGT
ncbi:MAG: hypothetical protein WKG07_20460 [Hymenobacter sp.]